MDITAQIVRLADITKDKRLQARAGLNDEAVERYAKLMDGGVHFDPVRLIRVYDESAVGDPLPLGGVAKRHRLYAVDGYHRLAATERIGRGEIHAHIEDGTWRDCVLAAAGANGAHGLPRSNEDRRRAVLMLLQDEEWARMPSRSVARLANVSHTLVNEIRAEFGVKVGETIDERAIARKDGTPSGKWIELLNRAQRVGDASAIERIRKLTSPRHLADERYGELDQEATRLRREELRAEGAREWPWSLLILSSTREVEIRRHALRLSVPSELARVLACQELPADLLPVLYRRLKDAMLIEEKNQYLVNDILKRHAPSVPDACDGIYEAARGLQAYLEEKEKQAKARQKSKERKRPDPETDRWGYERWLRALPESEMEKEIRSVPLEHLQDVYGYTLPDAVREGAWKQRTRGKVGKIAACPNPICAGKGGWIDFRGWCVICRKLARSNREDLSKTLTEAATLISAGLHMTVPLGAEMITVDAALLGALADLRRTPPEGYPAAARGLRALLDRPPTALFPDATPAPEPEPEEDVDEEEDGDWEGLVGDPEGEEDEEA